MYLPPPEEEEGEYYMNQPFVDRSALLRATLNSLAMSNVASVLNSKKHKKSIKDILEQDEEEQEAEEEEKKRKEHEEN